MNATTGIAAYPLYRRRANVGLALLMPNYTDNDGAFAWAKQLRADRPDAYIALRADNGSDAQQYSYGAAPGDEARRFADRFILPKLAKVPHNTFDCVLGACEFWPAPTEPDKLDWRAAFEFALCGIVQDELGLDYGALSVPVGNLEPADLHRFATVIRKARWVVYHAYPKPGNKTLEDSVADPYWAYRPTRLWLPKLRELGLPARFLFTESGTYWTPRATGLVLANGEVDRPAQAALCVRIATALAKDCADRGAECGGTLPFGMGVEGTMGTDWNLDGQEAVFEAAGTAPGDPPGDPPDGPEVPAGVSDYPQAVWRPVPSYGYPQGTHGRAGHQPVGVVEHITAGSAAWVYPWFSDPAHQASSHYLVRKDGGVEQYVIESDAAWANGQVAKPDLSNPFIADAVAHNVNPNLVTISIEHEQLTTEGLTEPQYQATLALHRWLFSRYKWPVEQARIIRHSQIDSVTRANDPGAAYPMARLLADLAKPPAPIVDRAKLTDAFNGIADGIIRARAEADASHAQAIKRLESLWTEMAEAKQAAGL